MTLEAKIMAKKSKALFASWERTASATNNTKYCVGVNRTNQVVTQEGSESMVTELSLNNIRNAKSIAAIVTPSREAEPMWQKSSFVRLHLLLAKHRITDRIQIR